MNGFTKEGKWEEYPDLPGGDGDYSVIREANGYRLADQLGERDGFGLQVWEKTEGDDTAYLVSLDTPTTWREVYCPDIPAFLEFMRLHGYAWLECGARELQRESLEEMTQLLTHDRYGIFRAEFARARYERDEYMRPPRPKATTGRGEYETPKQA